MTADELTVIALGQSRTFDRPTFIAFFDGHNPLIIQKAWELYYDESLRQYLDPLLRHGR